MTLQININPGAAVQGGIALGVMLAAGNPWAVPDALAHELVNRGVAQFVAVQSPFSRSGVKSIARQPVPRMKTVALAGDHTTLRQLELEAPFDAVRFWVPNLANAAVAGVKISAGLQSQVYAAGNGNNLNTIAPDYYLSASWGGAGTGTLAARIATEVPSWTPTDWLGMESVARTDGGVRPLIVFRTEVPQAGGTITVPYADFSAWDTASAQTGGRIDRAYTQAVLGVTNQGTFNSTVLDGAGFIPVMVEYSLKGVVVGRQVFCNGDSLPSGVGASGTFGYVARATLRNSTPSAPQEFVNLALHAQIPSMYVQYLEQMVNSITPDLVVIQPWSINAVGADVTSAVGRGSRVALVRQLAAVRKAGAIAVIANGSPASPGFKSFTNDVNRLAFNASLPAYAPGVPILDVSTLMASGVTDGVTGQMLINAAYSDDGVHYNNAGHDLAAVPLAALMEQAFLQ
jgi:lysophospholipase L1-like esterase